MVFSELLVGLIAWVLSFVKAYGAWSVFFAVILEEILLPIPSPLVLMGAGFLLVNPGLALNDALWQIFLVITIPASIASTIGSFFAYGIGFYGGKPLVEKTKRFLGFGWSDIKKAERRIEKGKKVWITIAILRAIPFFPIAIVSLAAGVLRLSWKKYAAATFVGAIPRTFILGFLGWWLGSAYVRFAAQLDILENVIAAAVIIAVVYLLHRYRHKYLHHVRKHMGKHVNRVRRFSGRRKRKERQRTRR